jgi:hypothetical protein
LAINLIVHVARVDGVRRLTEVVRVRSYDSETDQFCLETFTGITSAAGAAA